MGLKREAGGQTAVSLNVSEEFDTVMDRQESPLSGEGCWGKKRGNDQILHFRIPLAAL